jgi:NADH dehydrogenase
MRCVVTGGTGFVGRQLVRQLLAHHHEVILLTRSRSPAGTRQHSVPPTFPANPTFRPVDFHDPHALQSALHGAEVVVHLVGIIAEWGQQTFERVHVALTQSLLEAATSAQVPRWIHMSALGTRPQARARYHQTKWTAEHAVRHSTLSWTIFRPSIIYGAEDQFTRLFDRMAGFSPILPILGPGTNLLQPIGVAQVAQAFAGAIDHPEAVGKTLDLCGPERWTFNALIDAILEARGRRRAKLHLPWPLANAQARLLEALYSGLMNQQPPLNRDQILLLQENNVGDGRAADDLFHLHHPPLKEALREYLRP